MPKMRFGCCFESGTARGASGRDPASGFEPGEAAVPDCAGWVVGATAGSVCCATEGGVNHPASQRQPESTTETLVNNTFSLEEMGNSLAGVHGFRELRQSRPFPSSLSGIRIDAGMVELFAPKWTLERTGAAERHKSTSSPARAKTACFSSRSGACIRRRRCLLMLVKHGMNVRPEFIEYAAGHAVR